MPSSSSTTPARRPGRGDARQGAPPSRARTFWTWALVAVWAVLITFGLVSMTDPDWLEKFALQGRQSEAQVYKQYGDFALKKDNYGLAIAQYLRALDIRPDQAGVSVNLGIAYLESGDLARGREALLRAARMETTPGMRSVIAIQLGELSARENRRDEAIRYYQEALDHGARPDLVYRKLGALYLGGQDYLRARSLFERTLEGQCDSLLPYREMLRRTRENAGEDPELQRWLESEETRGLGAADWARYDLESIRRMQASDPEIAKTHNHLGLIDYRLGDMEAAIRHFEESLAIWPGNADAVRNLQILKSGD